MQYEQPEMVPEKLIKIDYERLAEFRYLLRRFLAFSGDEAEAAGLTPKQHQALLAIKGFPGRDHCSIGELAERLCIRHHSAVGLVDRLELRGLVQRQTDTASRKVVRIGLTAEAESQLAGLSQVHSDELKRIAPLLKRLIGELEATADGG